MMRGLLLTTAALTACLHVSAQDDARTDDNLKKYTISAEGINASYIAYGATLTNLYVKDRDGNFQDVVMGYDDGAGYVNDTQNEHTYFGATVGRYAGRIRNGTFNLDGTQYHIPTNENDGANSLHGGKTGYDQRNWTLISTNSTSITFSLDDNYFEGYPGRVITYATFTVNADPSCNGSPSLTTRLISIPVDGPPAPIMLTTHPYFNLNGFVDPTHPDILDHTLHLPYSPRYIPGDNILVPTGSLATVANTPLDFTQPGGATFASAITEGKVQGCGFNCTGVDTCFIIDRPASSAREDTAVKVLELRSERSGIRFDLFTDQTAVVVYTCNQLEGTIPLKRSQQHGPNGETQYAQIHGCVAIETQGWVDALNHPEWGQRDYQVFEKGGRASTMLVRYVFGVDGKGEKVDMK